MTFAVRISHYVLVHNVNKSFPYELFYFTLIISVKFVVLANRNDKKKYFLIMFMRRDSHYFILFTILSVEEAKKRKRIHNMRIYNLYVNTFKTNIHEKELIDDE